MPQEMYDWSHEFSAVHYNILTDKKMTFSVPLDLLGRFTLRMPIEKTAQLFCDWGRSTILLVAEPGETYFVMRDFSNSTTLVMGRNARPQNEILAHELVLYYPDCRKLMREMGAIQFMQECDKDLKKYLTILDKKMVKHPALFNRYKTTPRTLPLLECQESSCMTGFRYTVCLKSTSTT